MNKLHWENNHQNCPVKEGRFQQGVVIIWQNLRLECFLFGPGIITKMISHSNEYFQTTNVSKFGVMWRGREDSLFVLPVPSIQYLFRHLLMEQCQFLFYLTTHLQWCDHNKNLLHSRKFYLQVFKTRPVLKYWKLSHFIHTKLKDLWLNIYYIIWKVIGQSML